MGNKADHWLFWIEMGKVDDQQKQIVISQTPSSTAIKMRPPSPSIPEKEFLFNALRESLRIDGRAMLEMRTPQLTFGPELGWVECAFGKTRFFFSPLFTNGRVKTRILQ